MKSAQKKKALELRIKHKLGYAAIAKRVSVSKSTLTRWLKDYPLTEKRILELRRDGWSRGEVKREKFRETMRKKRAAREGQEYRKLLKRFDKISEQALFVAGLMLYLAEGDKKDAYRIGLANTDPKIISFFIWWLERFLGISRSDLRIQLHLYQSMNRAAERKYWQAITGLPEAQFYKDQVRPLHPNSFSYSESFRHGTCKIYANGREKTTELMLSIRAFFDRYDTLRALRA